MLCRLVLFSGLVALGHTSEEPTGITSTTRKYRFLAYSPQICWHPHQFANSHVNFMGKISDALVDAGHHVTLLSPLIDRNVGTSGTKKAQVIELPQTPYALVVESFMTQMQSNMWKAGSPSELFKDWDKVSAAWAQTCNDTLHTPGLVERLRAERFDVGYMEAMDFCGFGLFHLAGITKVAITQSLAIIDGSYFITQTPSLPSYVPSALGGTHGVEMSFFQRIENIIPAILMDWHFDKNIPATQRFFDEAFPSFPPLKELASNISLVFLNSEPLLDFPRITTHRIIEVGGIVVNGEHKALNKTWSDIMDLRPRTVLLSFGSFAKAYHMPEEYKKTIRETLKKFPDVTFIFKYEKPEHNISAGIPNVIESTWAPQVDMLYDPRLTAFITHCGQGSTTEANIAGVPLLVIPVAADQLRNAQQVVRNGLGIMLEKTALATTGPLEEAIKQLLENESTFRNTANRLAAMIQDRPFKMKDVFVRNMEFLAVYGPLRMLDHEGRNLNILQFYLVDVFAFMALVALIVVGLVLVVLRTVFRLITRVIRIKKKVD